jgi:hypothetical protein
MEKPEQQFRETYEPTANFYENPSSVSFAPPSTPSSTTSFTDASMYAGAIPQPGNQFYSSPPAVAPTSVPPTVAVQYDQVSML